MTSHYEHWDHAQTSGIRLVQETDDPQRGYDICN